MPVLQGRIVVQRLLVVLKKGMETVRPGEPNLANPYMGHEPRSHECSAALTPQCGTFASLWNDRV